MLEMISQIKNTKCIIYAEQHYINRNWKECND